ncbi:hypothetical protein ACFQ2B_32170 [Streptomyces stramineus]
MKICLLTPTPDHPVLAAATALLTPRHQVESLDPGTAEPLPGRSPRFSPTCTCSRRGVRAPWPSPAFSNSTAPPC